MRFVLIHELAHMMSIDYGHGEEFQHYFKSLLDISVLLNKYSPVDYKQRHTRYCGYLITTSPLF
jgi:hypothetical protein